MTATDSLRIRTAFAYALLQPCVICDGAATTPGMFLPYAEHTRALRSARGDRRRIIFYALCEECFCSPTREQDAEDAILRGRA